jgi:SAM-dependent methyltransferase
MTARLPALYGELAGWFHLLTAPEEYAEEAAFFTKLLREATEGDLQTVLELGSGGGNNASHMKVGFDMVLTDLSEGMLALSRTINPELEHIQGDMRTLHLGRTFDAVFVHDAVCYMLTEDDLGAAIATAAKHCRPGGGVVLAPDCVRETFRESTDHGGHDGVDGRGLRYLEWCYDPDPADTTYTTEFAILMREADGSVRVTHDRHVDGLFPRATWLRLMDECGLESWVTPLVHSEVEPGMHEVFVGTKRR